METYGRKGSQQCGESTKCSLYEPVGEDSDEQLPGRIIAAFPPVAPAESTATGSESVLFQVGSSFGNMRGCAGPGVCRRAIGRAEGDFFQRNRDEHVD